MRWKGAIASADEAGDYPKSIQHLNERRGSASRSPIATAILTCLEQLAIKYHGESSVPTPASTLSQ